MTELDEFMNEYEQATNSHDFDNVEKLITEDAVYWFTDGVFNGRQSIRKAFEQTWQKVENEVYEIKNLQWLVADEKTAVCIYDFHWSGTIDGIKKQGQGKGTNVLVKNSQWQIVHEHLSKPA